MTARVRCPSCNKRLRVPEDWIGRNVKCPRCGEKLVTHVAGEPPPGREPIRAPRLDPISEPAPPRDGVRESPLPPPPPPEYVEPPRPRRRPRREAFNEYDPRPPRIGRRAKARQAVLAPAIMLIIVGGLGVAMGVLNVGSASSRPVPLMYRADPDSYVTGRFVGAAISLLWGIVVTAGGIMMMMLRGHGIAYTAAIFAMFPCNPACIFGLPAGIWAMSSLNDPEISAAFR